MTNDIAPDHMSQDAEDEMGAAIINTLLVRIQQTGRNFITATDYKALRMMLRASMSLNPVEPVEHLGRPQTLPQDEPSAALDDMERALRSHADETYGGRRMPSAAPLKVPASSNSIRAAAPTAKPQLQDLSTGPSTGRTENNK